MAPVVFGALAAYLPAVEGKRGREMNWRKEALEKLSRYDEMCRAAEIIPRQILLLKDQCGAVSKGWSERPGVRASARSREDALIDNIATRQELKWSLEQVRRWIRLMDRGLGSLDDRERTILEQLYIYPQTGGVERLCLELGLEKTSIYRHRDRALEKFTRAMYGITESN